MDSKMFNLLIIVVVIVYALAPDLAPGPMDDMIVMLLGYLISSKKEKNKDRIDEEDR